MRIVRQTTEIRRVWYEMDITPEYLAHMQSCFNNWTNGFAPTITEEMIFMAVNELPDRDLDILFTFSWTQRTEIKPLREAIYDFIMDDLWEFEVGYDILDTYINETKVRYDE